MRILYVPGVGVLFLGIFLLQFFRDPEREIAKGITAPADGVIKGIEDVILDIRTGKMISEASKSKGRVQEKQGHQKRYVRIITFMNIHNVHVNRIPIGGKVIGLKHHPGKYLAAYKKESELNERVEMMLSTPLGRVKVVQIAGLVARRIVPYVKEGQEVLKGDRFGMIRLGSRVDLYLPKDGVEVMVKKGAAVNAGSTTIARVKGGSR